MFEQVQAVDEGNETGPAVSSEIDIDRRARRHKVAAFLALPSARLTSFRSAVLWEAEKNELMLKNAYVQDKSTSMSDETTWSSCRDAKQKGDHAPPAQGRESEDAVQAQIGAIQGKPDRSSVPCSCSARIARTLWRFVSCLAGNI